MSSMNNVGDVPPSPQYNQIQAKEDNAKPVETATSTIATIAESIIVRPIPEPVLQTSTPKSRSVNDQTLAPKAWQTFQDGERDTLVTESNLKLSNYNVSRFLSTEGSLIAENNSILNAVNVKRSLYLQGSVCNSTISVGGEEVHIENSTLKEGLQISDNKKAERTNIKIRGTEASTVMIFGSCLLKIVDSKITEISIKKNSTVELRGANCEVGNLYMVEGSKLTVEDGARVKNVSAKGGTLIVEDGAEVETVIGATTVIENSGGKVGSQSAKGIVPEGNKGVGIKSE